MRAGWFKKARKKFIKKRVDSFKFREGMSGTIYRDWTLEFKGNCQSHVSYRHISNEDRQIIAQLRGTSFVKAFLASRKLALQKPKDYSMVVNKKIKKIV